jgi:hypothetical protein
VWYHVRGGVAAMKFWKHPAMPMVLLLVLFVAIVVAFVAGIVLLNQPRREAPVRIGHDTPRVTDSR